MVLEICYCCVVCDLTIAVLTPSNLPLGTPLYTVCVVTAPGRSYAIVDVCLSVCPSVSINVHVTTKQKTDIYSGFQVTVRT